MSISLRVASVTASLFLVGAVLAVQPEKSGQGVEPPLIPVPHSEKTLGLAECIEIASTQQPHVRAAISSLQSTELGLKSLNALNPVAGMISPDLRYRKQQGEQGVAVGSADVRKTLDEARYDVTRMYFSFVYARQQDVTIDDIVKQLDTYLGFARAASNTPGSKINRFILYSMEEQIADVKKQRITARIGQSQALAALKEAMGVDQNYDFVPRDTELPIMGGTVTQEEVVCFALSRRPEIAMAAAGVDAFRLEVDAQKAIRFKQKVQTLAIGSDLHARFIPGPHRNGDYRPGALAPEMPATLVGSRDNRVARACEILTRQETLFDKTRDLVTLEAVNAYFHWLACSERMRQAKVRYERGVGIAKDAKDTMTSTGDYDPLIRLQAMAGKGQADYVQTVFDHVNALAALDA